MLFLVTYKSVGEVANPEWHIHGDVTQVPDWHHPVQDTRMADTTISFEVASDHRAPALHLSARFQVCG